MAKRKAKSSEDKRKKLKQERDAKLSTGLFSQVGDNSDVDDDHGDNWEDEEQDYELKPRTLKDDTSDFVEGLPIKMADGKIQRVIKQVENKKAEEKVPEPEELEEAEQQSEPLEPQEEPEEEEDEDAHLTPEERTIKLKEEIAEIVEKILEEPEENIKLLSRLRKMSESKNVITQRLSLLALVPLFKAISPGYRIRPLTDAEKREKVSRDIQKLRYFEESLVTNYKSYIDYLAKLARVSTTTQKASTSEIVMGRIATMAACELASSLRNFNYRVDLFTIIIRRLNRRPTDSGDNKAFTKCITTLEELLNEDEASGDISFDIVRIMSKSMKDKSYRVDESVVNIFLSLSLLTDYDPNNNKDDTAKVHVKKKDRVHLSKKERKARKERKEIDEEMRKAEQAVSTEERERFQGQVLKLLLKAYLEILKYKPDSLMAPVLEGLARYGNMVNIDLLGDFLEVLREVSNDILANDIYTSTEIRQVLLCIVTSFALVSNHSQLKLPVDLSQFISSLYSILPHLSFDSDIEFSHKSLRLQDPLSTVNENFKPSVNVSTEIELLLKSLDNIFFRSKAGTKTRATAFTKKVYTSMLHMPEKSTIALLKFIDKLLGRYSEIAGLYTIEDRINNGVFYIEVDDIERSNPNAATLWETVLLSRHYCPTVANGSRALLNKAKAANKDNL